MKQEGGWGFHDISLQEVGKFRKIEDCKKVGRKKAFRGYNKNKSG